jgi:hypothetical protein
MNNTVQKIDNNALFAKTLLEHPPKYNIGDKVKTNFGISTVTSRIYNEREKNWKYTVIPFGLKNVYFDAKYISDLNETH